MVWLPFLAFMIVFLIFKYIQSNKFYEDKKRGEILKKENNRKLSIRGHTIKYRKRRFISPPSYQRPFKSTKLD